MSGKSARDRFRRLAESRPIKKFGKDEIFDAEMPPAGKTMKGTAEKGADMPPRTERRDLKQQTKFN